MLEALYSDDFESLPYLSGEVLPSDYVVVMRNNRAYKATGFQMRGSGFADYAHAGSAVSHTGAGDATALTNDGAGADSIKHLYLPAGCGDLWDIANQRFDFGGLQLGDMVNIRLDCTVTTSSNYQEINIELHLGGGVYSIPFVAGRVLKQTGAYRIAEMNGIYLGNELTRGGYGQFKVSSPNNLSLLVHGWYVSVIRR